MKFCKLPSISTSLGLAIVLLTSQLSGCSKETENTANAPYHHQADIIDVQLSSHYVVETQYVGQVTTTQNTRLGFEFAGKVDKVYADSGEKIIKDQILAEQNTELLTLKVDELRAAIKQTQAQVALNNANLKRINSLMKNDYSSQQRLDELSSEKQVLNAELSRLTSQLESIQYQISKAQLTAPFNGVVSNRTLAEGEVVSAGTLAFQLIKQGQNEVKFGLPPALASKLSLGDSLPVKLAQQQLTTKVIAIGQQVNTSTRTVEIRLQLPVEVTAFNGQLVYVSVKDTVNSQGMWLPTVALTDGLRGQWNIYQAKKQSDGLYKINAVTVKVLHSTKEHSYVEMLDDNIHFVVAHGLHRYVPGQTVRASANKDSRSNEKEEVVRL